MTTKKQETKQEIFEPTTDPATGRVRLDRPLSADEAAEQDRANVERLMENRRNRFRKEVPSVENSDSVRE